ncbi:hypothetical protein [Chryseobacterium arthrosphaerae]|uniref:hypothetical protein n=1 Tax=Chryseobacterium arthrosphaerae TaxID=651561 RepID=UPI003D33D9AE
MDILDTLANICSILAFIVSLFVANEAIKISKKINVNIKAENSNSNKQTAFGKNEQKIKVGK